VSQTGGIIMERDVPSVMRDGTVLKAEVYRPAAEGRYPVLLERIPYSKAFMPFAALFPQWGQCQYKAWRRLAFHHCAGAGRG